MPCVILNEKCELRQNRNTSNTFKSFTTQNERCYLTKRSVWIADLHHCVIIFFWSSGIMDCTCMLFTFENGVTLMC